MKNIPLLLCFALLLTAQDLYTQHEEKGKALAAEQKWELARKEFRAAIGEAGMDPKTGDSIQSAISALRIAQTYRDEGKPDAAIDWYKQSLHYHASNQARDEMMALELQRLGQPLSAPEIQRALTVPSADRSPVAEGNTIDIEVLFAKDSSVVTPEGLDQIHQLALAITAPELAGQRFTIVGHTDDTGPLKNPEQYNLALSVERAKSVRAALLAESPNLANRIRYEGKGMQNPKYPNTSEQARRLNRRVQITQVD